MPNYRRIHIPGGTYFFTVITFDRAPFLCDLTARRALREAIQKTRLKRPFQIEAWVLLPDHFHCMLTLPEKQENYSAIIKSIKSAFTRNPQTFGYRQENKRLSKSRAKKREQTIWQRRFWEHAIRDEKDFANHFHYIHYNPVKHGLCPMVSGWHYSSFWRYVKQGYYRVDWASGRAPDFPEAPVGE